MAGSPIGTGALLRVFLWPLTQWDLGDSCAAGCVPHTDLVGGVPTPKKCDAPVCETEALAKSGVGRKRNVMKLTFTQMDPITDAIRHTVVLSNLKVPEGGFFGTVMSGELQESDGMRPSYSVSTGALVYAKPIAVGSVVGHGGGGNDKPFRSDQLNTLYARIVLGASIWSAGTGHAGFEILLPSGYVCTAAGPAEDNLPVFQEAPQGRGEVGLDTDLDGYWVLSGQACIYTLQRNSAVYAGSALFVKLTVTNPVFALPRHSPTNVWMVHARGRGAPQVTSSVLEKRGRLNAFVDLGGYLHNNVPVIGKLSQVTLAPTLLGAGQDRNWLSVFFMTEQKSPGTSPRLELRVPSGFSFMPQCRVEALPQYYYATSSSAAVRTVWPQVVWCRSSRTGKSEFLDQANMWLSEYMTLDGSTMYGFRIQVYNAASFQQSQLNGFHITTRASNGDGLDSSFHTMRFLAGEGEGAGKSFGVYRLPMVPGSFVVGLGNMLPYAETGLASRIVIFPLRVPFDSRSSVDWRIVAPHGYEWSFLPEDFQYRMRDILGATADLPIQHIPDAPGLPPLNVLNFVNNFAGAWDQTQVYGLIAAIRVPEATPSSSVNSFFVEFGFSGASSSERYAGASFDAPRVQALVNVAVDYQDTSLAGQQNRLLFQLETITNIVVGGGFVIEAPPGFVFEERCVVLDSPMREAPYVDLSTAAAAVCSSEVPYTTNRPLVTIAVVAGEVRAASYEFMLDAQNPRTELDAVSVAWKISALANLGLAQPADLAATVLGFPIESPMRSGELLSEVDYSATKRDDHPLQETFVILSFRLDKLPVADGPSVLTVKAPLGYKFPALCEVVVGQEVFGALAVYPIGYAPFDASAGLLSCFGSRNTARLLIQPGLQNQRTYAFRIGIFNPAITPEHNTWTLSFAGESTVPFAGYRLWSFAELLVTASHAARSTDDEETRNRVSIRLRPANAITNAGFLAVSAPFGFLVPTLCSAVLHRLDPLGNAVQTVPHIQCKGKPQPTNTGEIHIDDPGTKILALELYALDLEVINPLTIPVDPGSWRLQSFSSKTASYAMLLDVGETPSFIVTEVFRTLSVKYPPYTNPNDDYLSLEFQVVLPQAIELGDTIRITVPEGYDFAVATSSLQLQLEFRQCAGFVRIAPSELPDPKCLRNVVLLVFEKVGLALDTDVRLTPLMAFKIRTVYPRRTLEASKTVAQGEHLRGGKLLASKRVPIQQVIPRLQGLDVKRLDSMTAVRSTSSIQLEFSPSQRADVLEITTIGAALDPLLSFGLTSVKASARVQTQIVEPMTVVSRSNTTLLLQFEIVEGLQYTLTLLDVVNPSRSGRALWTVATYLKPTNQEEPVENWALPANRRDRVLDFVGPLTVSRIELDPEATVLGSPYFDMDGTELLLGFRVYPDAVSAGQYLILRAPFGYEFVDRTFKPGEGFPVVSGSVFIRKPDSQRTNFEYVVQILTKIQANQLIRFGVRVNAPRTPDDLAQWETDTSPRWMLTASEDAEGATVMASNDLLFPGFVLMASFGEVSIVPEPNGVTPRKTVSVDLTINPRSSLTSLVDGGTIFLRIMAPIGFDFLSGCLAVTPNPVFEACFGIGRSALLPVKGAFLPAGRSMVELAIRNAGITPSDNTWLLESLLDVSYEEALAVARADAQRTSGSLGPSTPAARQRSRLEGYTIRELIQATIGANTQRAAVTTVYVWFLATYFVDLGGAVELHAPQGYELRCQPQIEYISLPPGTCKLASGVIASSGDRPHYYVTITLNVPGQQLLPNIAYEFGVPVVNPSQDRSPNFWGIALRSSRKELVDSSMTIEGYKLTDFQLLVHSLLASSVIPSVVNQVRITLAFQKEIGAGTIGHITILAPSSTKVLCQLFQDLTGGGSSLAKLPLDPEFGTYGTHDCMLPNSITLHVLPDKPIRAASYVLRLSVLNPRFRAVQDYWTVQLLAGPGPPAPFSIAGSAVGQNVTGNASSNMSAAAPAQPTAAPALPAEMGSDWETAAPVLAIRIPGYGVSGAFAGPVVLPYLDANLARRRHEAPPPLLLLLAGVGLIVLLTGFGTSFGEDQRHFL
eukprot:TRINITY_DN5053_c0_g2_i1.p1 TRINITY_DN5053_c0_g2~~TRINITY_DN5053_c0_g2_i1.p1  ORF type:complete len:2124 (+),score=252.10 TRINITY_DN5053_c0_g2_i1:188-6373(+)